VECNSRSSYSPDVSNQCYFQAAGSTEADWGAWLGAAAVILASINVFGGFLVTQRMLEMFKKKDKKGQA